jgi:hypothetical protein
MRRNENSSNRKWNLTQKRSSEQIEYVKAENTAEEEEEEMWYIAVRMGGDKLQSPRDKR